MRISELRNLAVALVAATVSFTSLGAWAQDTDQTPVVNPFSPAYNHAHRRGVVPTMEAHKQMKQWRSSVSMAAAATTATTGPNTLSYLTDFTWNGHLYSSAVTTIPRVYLVVYGSQWGSPGKDANGNMTLSNDKVGAVPYLQRMYKGLGTASEGWSGVLTQYCDTVRGATSCAAGSHHIPYPSSTVFAGIMYDDSQRASSAPTANDLIAEVEKASVYFGNNTPLGKNSSAQYVIMSPPGTHPDGFNSGSSNFCAWHNYVNDYYGEGEHVLYSYTNMPYVSDMGASCGANFVNHTSAGILDGFSIVAAHEYAESASDMYPSSGWVNRTGSASAGEEIGDECAWGIAGNVAFSTGSFPLPALWSNDENTCSMSHAIVR